MQIFVPRETHSPDPRVALLPQQAESLVLAGANLQIECGLGESVYATNGNYTEKGAVVTEDRMGALRVADMVLRLNPPPPQEAGAMKSGSIHISHLDPFRNTDLVSLLAKSGVSAISMELIPRTTLAQKMDALSSQANLAGYAAVIVAAGRLKKIFPMMSTPAGTIAPARVFVIGAGVAGLQAIATAKRLGAVVEAFDTRPVVEEQVKSLGARFVKVDLGDTGQTKDGYAKPLTEEQLGEQRDAMARHCASADVVITTAKLFGRPAPRIVTDDMLQGMAPGSIVVDLAVESGGNVEGSEVDEEVVRHGVRILGLANPEGRAAIDASQVYASNLVNFVTHFWDEGQKSFQMDTEDELIQGSLITHGGEIVNELIRKTMEPGI